LERHFRRALTALVDQVADGRLSDWRSLFKVEGPSESLSWRAITRCGRSVAISPFYVGVGVLLLVGVIIAW
jgi:hypothetical protein